MWLRNYLGQGQLVFKPRYSLKQKFYVINISLKSVIISRNLLKLGSIVYITPLCRRHYVQYTYMLIISAGWLYANKQPKVIHSYTLVIIFLVVFKLVSLSHAFLQMVSFEVGGNFFCLSEKMYVKHARILRHIRKWKFRTNLPIFDQGRKMMRKWKVKIHSQYIIFFIFHTWFEIHPSMGQ